MKIQLWGRGGEIVIGSITREQYVYWKLKEEDSDDFSNMIMDDELEDEHPEEMLLGPWYDIDNVAHESGAALDSAGITVTDDDDNVLYEGMISDLTEEDGLEELAEETDEVYFSDTDHEFGFWAYDAQKGVFEEYTIKDVNAWDPKLLKVEYADIDGNTLITNIKYAGKDLEGDGALSTDGKGFDWGFCTNGRSEDVQQG
jgi:hypothetical protein